MQDSPFRQSCYSILPVNVKVEALFPNCHRISLKSDTWSIREMMLILMWGKSSIALKSQHSTVLNKLETFVKTDHSTSLLWHLSRLLSSGSLIIISPSVDDTATYECTVTNDAGEDKRTVDLTVQGRTILVCKLKVIIMISFHYSSLTKGTSFSS